MKVYCSNCKYLGSYEGEMGEFHYLCYHPSNIISVFNAIHIWTELIHKPEVKNKKNNCYNYKRLWYKFWIKE
jgi:hypothetical protein